MLHYYFLHPRKTSATWCQEATGLNIYLLSFDISDIASYTVEMLYF